MNFLPPLCFYPKDRETQATKLKVDWSPHNSMHRNVFGITDDWKE